MRTNSGEVILHAIHGRSALDSNGCDIQSNAGDSSTSYHDDTGEAVRIDQANGEGTMSNGQTDIGVAPVEVAANSLDLSRWILPSDTPEDISLDQLAQSGDPRQSGLKNSEQDLPTLDTVGERVDISAGEFLEDTS